MLLDQVSLEQNFQIITWFTPQTKESSIDHINWVWLGEMTFHHSSNVSFRGPITVQVFALNHIINRTLRTCFLSSFNKICSMVEEKKSKNVSANQRPARPSWMTDRHENHKLCRGCWRLASCQVSSKSVHWLWSRSWKMFQPTRGQGGHLKWCKITLILTDYH